MDYFDEIPSIFALDQTQPTIEVFKDGTPNAL